MKRRISILLLLAFTTAILPANAFGPTPGQLEYQNNGYSPSYNQYGSFSNTPQYNDYNSYNYNQNYDSYGEFGLTPGQQETQYNDYNNYNQNGGSYGSFSNTPQYGWGATRDDGSYGSFSNTPQQGWGNTRDDGSFYISDTECNHWETDEYDVDTWYDEYNDNKHIVYTEIEVRCKYCQHVYETFVEEDYEKHNFNNRNECKDCGYDAGCDHKRTSRQTPKYWYEIYDEHYHSEVYIEEEVCNYCGEVLDSQEKSKIWSHQYQYGGCWICGYVQQSSTQSQYTPPVVNEPEYVEPEPEEKYVEEPVYVEQPQQNTNTQTSNLLPYQEALEQGRVYASTADGLHLYKRNYVPNDYRGYQDEYYHTVKTKYDNFTLPAGEVLAQKGDYLYRHSDNSGGIVAAAPSIIKTCDYRINELKNTLKGASDASTRVEQYKQVKRGKMPLSSISERNKIYLAQTGTSNSYVTQVQEALKGLGYTSQTISGKLDSTTLNNIAYFQSTKGIYMTGWIDQETYNAITSSFTSYTNTQQKATRAPYVYLNDIHMEGRDLVVSMQGNAKTTMLIIQIRYNGTVVDAETLYGTNSATVYLSPRESGIHYIEFFARNANDEIYEASIQEIDINLPKGDGSTPLGITAKFCLGLGDSVVSLAQGVGGVILHPIKTIQSIEDFAGNVVATVADEGVGELRNQAVYALTEIITITWNQLDNNTTEENARVVGKVVGDIVIAVLVTKGLEKGTAALKASANSGKLTQTTKSVINGVDTVDDAARTLSVSSLIIPDAEDLIMSQSVQNHMLDIIKKGANAGELSRPYIDSKGTTLLLKEIMASKQPVQDAVVQSALRWDVTGIFRGSNGIWELVVDTATNKVLHFNFISQ